jgi:hypothetical protein
VSRTESGARFCSSVFPLAGSLSSVTSAADRSALFGDFSGTTDPSDFPASFIIGVRLMAFPMRPSTPSVLSDVGTSRFPCMKIPHVHGVSDRTGSRSCL